MIPRLTTVVAVVLPRRHQGSEKPPRYVFPDGTVPAPPTAMIIIPQLLRHLGYGQASISILAAGMILVGCGEVTPPDPHENQDLIVVRGAAATAALIDLGGQPGTSFWHWHLTAPANDRSGRAVLEVGNTMLSWRLAGATHADTLTGLTLCPDDPIVWHDQFIPADKSDIWTWLPIPRIQVRSPYYADLLDLVTSLTFPLHGDRVVHWAREPIPVVPSLARGSHVDFGACLAEAVTTWNSSFGKTLFEWDQVFAEGVRLVYRPGEILRPPMWARLLRTDEAGRPLLIHIVAGDNYDRPTALISAKRALVHELAHALQLWGHSLDPEHVLWRWGPVVDAPAAEEVLAVRWWRRLPEGIDLGRYGRSVELDPDGLKGQGAAVEQRDEGYQAPQAGAGLDQSRCNGRLVVPETLHDHALKK